MNTEDVLSEVQSMTGKKIRRYSEPGRRRVRRPEEIIRDVRGLKLRQRVSLVLADQVLRDELEQTIKNGTNGSAGIENIRAYQDFLLPAHQPNLINIGKGFGGGIGSTVLPINDIKGNDTLNYSQAERLERNKLASVYRLVDLMGWSEGITNHISVRPDPDKHEFLLQPFGLLFSEVTASSLLKCDLEGNIIDGGSTTLGINKAGFVLHSCIHECRPDIRCIIHLHTSDVVAISGLKCGFLRVSQESLIVGNVSYHDYCGILINEEEKESIREDLGPENMVMFLRNHGAVVCGVTIEEAFQRLFDLMNAVEMQVKMMSMAGGLDNLHIISDAAFDQVQDLMKNSTKVTMSNKGSKAMTVSEYSFEAWMRWLDSQGYRTGYMYRMPDVFNSGSPTKKIPESMVPPQVSSDRIPYQVYYDQQQGAAPGMFGAPSMGRGNTHRNRLKWLNNPVQGTRYEKIEKEHQRPQLEPPILDEAPPVLNGHVEENVTETISNDTKVVTKTTTVTETKVITGVSSGNPETVVVNRVSGTCETATNGGTDGDVADGGVEVQSPVTSLNGTASEEVNGGPAAVNDVDSEELTNGDQKTSEINGENIKSPPSNKVKKQKSFKKALMKKFKKDEK